MGISRENMQNSSSLGQYDDEKSDTEGSGGAKVPDPFVPRHHAATLLHCPIWCFMKVILIGGTDDFEYRGAALFVFYIFIILYIYYNIYII